MQVLRTLFWVLLAVVAVVFAIGNNEYVDVNLGSVVMNARLWVLLGIAFLIGWLPTFLWYRAIRWRLRARLAARDREVAELRGPVPEPLPEPTPAPAAVPTAVPPGVA